MTSSRRRLQRSENYPKPVDHLTAGRWMRLVPDDCPPSHGERLGRAPVHRSEPGLVVRHLEGLHHMLIVSPAVEVCALDYCPVSFEPGSHQRVAANHLQVCNVLWPEEFVVSQLARNEDAILLDGLARPLVKPYPRGYWTGPPQGVSLCLGTLQICISKIRLVTFRIPSTREEHHASPHQNS